jgi:hypothetical protein
VDAEKLDFLACLAISPTAVTFHIVLPSAKLAQPVRPGPAVYLLDVFEVFRLTLRS